MPSKDQAMQRAPLRIAVVSTPRVGNSWIRTLIADAYQVPGLPFHELSADDWRELPPECVLQIHWRKEPGFEAALRENGFRVLTVCRHPLDVLISILQFAIHEPATARWLQGRHGNESGIWGAMPRSRSFIEYAASPRAAELLAVTCDWWGQPGVVGVRYEDFVADPIRELTRLSAEYGPLRVDPRAVCERSAMGKLPTINSHHWQGRPGLWRTFLPAAEAQEIAAAIGPVLERLGYVCDPDSTLSPSEADRNWVQRAGPALRAGLDRAMSGHRLELELARAESESLRQRIAELERAGLTPPAGCPSPS
jgi:hypothetical protein